MSGVFDTIVCGVDETPASLEAVRQAARLRAGDGRLRLFCAVYLAGAVAAGWSATRIAEELEREAGEALERAAEAAGPGASRRLVNGPAVRSLLRELGRTRATLVCVGTHGLSRPAGIVLGGVSTTMLHEAPCSVLVARPVDDPERFPGRIVIGVDGSAEADRALETALALRKRFGSDVAAIAATRDKPLGRVPAWAERVDAHPVEALVRASEDADLLLLGSRGLHGVRALGSVGERVAHRAACSVLVVREGPAQPPR